jgi:hypothetical protein
MKKKTCNRFVASVIEGKHTSSMVEDGRGGGNKSLKSFCSRPVGQSNGYTREISIGGCQNAG